MFRGWQVRSGWLLIILERNDTILASRSIPLFVNIPSASAQSISVSQSRGEAPVNFQRLPGKMLAHSFFFSAASLILLRIVLVHLNISFQALFSFFLDGDFSAAGAAFHWHALI